MAAPVEIWTVDIETRPNEVYAWGLRDQNIGLNQIIRPGGLLMFAAQKHGQKAIVTHADWDGNDDPAGNYETMVERIHGLYDRADYIVTYNGARFDNKHLRAAWAELGLAPPSPWRDIDLFKTVGKFNWPSRKLAFVCQQLGLDHKTDPGGFETWDQILRGTGKEQAAARQRMKRYCANDVRITTQLFERLLPWIDGLNIPMITDDGTTGALQCTRCGSTSIHQRGWAYTTTYRYKRFQCQGCGGWMRAKSSEPLANAELRNA